MINPEDFSDGVVEFTANHLKIGDHTIILSNVDVGVVIASMKSAVRQLEQNAPDSESLPILRNVLTRLSVVHESFGPPPRRGTI